MAAFTVTHMFLNVNKGRSCYSVVNRSRFSQFVPFTNRVREIPSKCSLQLPRIRMEAQDLAKQMKEMAAAQRRWESQVREGKVKALTPKEASYAMQLSNKVLLDVRPSTERRKAWVKDSIWIPVFDVDRKQDLETIPKKISNFVMGGWWSGIPLMVYNDKFIRQVEEKISKDANIIVACQSGIRSLAACEQLYNVGYRNLHWIRGGLDAAEEADLERSGMQPLKFAGIGGISEFLGCWKRYEPIGRLSGEEGSGFLCGLSSLEGRARARFVGRGKMPELFVQGDHSDGKADTSSCQVACKVRSNSGRVVYKIAWIWSNSGGGEPSYLKASD